MSRAGFPQGLCITRTMKYARFATLPLVHTFFQLPGTAAAGIGWDNPAPNLTLTVAPAPTPSVETAAPRLKFPKRLFLEQLPDQDQGAVPRPVSQGVRPPEPQDPLKKASFMKVLQYSVQLIFYEHVMRVAVQPFTRAELDGPFWRDYINSVKMPKKWGDLDSWEVNYIGHSMAGSSGVRLWLVQREPNHLGNGNKHYWKAMFRGFLFSILFSEQFEIGPLSEASIGNVGLREGRTGWTDHIVTPFGAVLWTMYEDAVDKWVLTWIEKHVPLNMAKVAARLILCPGWMLANIGMNRLPWDRPGRPLSFTR
jgi:hypothetical protein